MTAVVLAAGEGQRMGGSKLLAPFRGRPLLERTVERVEGLPVQHKLLVLGAYAEHIRQHLGLSGWLVAINDRWSEGLSSSLRKAEACAPAGGLLVFLGDMPCVPREACLEVIGRAKDRPVAPECQGVRGFPVYLPFALRPALHELKGDRGARELLKDCVTFPCGDPGVVQDVDTAEDLRCIASRD